MSISTIYYGWLMNFSISTMVGWWILVYLLWLVDEYIYLWWVKKSPLQAAFLEFGEAFTKPRRSSRFARTVLLGSGVVLSQLDRWTMQNGWAIHGYPTWNYGNPWLLDASGVPLDFKRTPGTRTFRWNRCEHPSVRATAIFDVQVACVRQVLSNPKSESLGSSLQVWKWPRGAHLEEFSYHRPHFFDFLDYFPISPKTFFIWKDVGPLFWGLDEYLSIMHGLYKDHVWWGRCEVATHHSDLLGGLRHYMF